MRQMATVLSLWILATGQAQDTVKAVIKAPAKAMAGDLIVLNGQESVGSGHQWRLVGSSKTFLPVDGGQRCVFSSGLGKDRKPITYRFVLAVGKLDKDGKSVAVDVAIHDLVVAEDDSVDPVTPVGPDKPKPAPEFPDSKFGLAKVVWTSAQAAKLPYMVTTGPALAENYRSVGSMVAANKSQYSKQTILAALTVSNRKTLGIEDPNTVPPSSAPWVKFINETLGNELDRLSREGKFGNPPDAGEIADALADIAAGLEALK